MKRLVLILSVLTTALQCNAAEQADIDKTIEDLKRRLEVMEKVANGDYETSPPKLEWERKIIVEEVQKSVSGCKEPYRRWSDGTVSYLGKCLYVMGGIIPRGNEPKINIITFKNYKVLDVAPEGCRVVYKKDEDKSEDSDAFVEGMKGYFSGRAYKDVLFARYVGSHTYTTTGGGSRTIPKYEYGTPISKEEFVAAVGKQAVPQGKH